MTPSLCCMTSGILLTEALYVTSVGHVTVSLSPLQLSLACGTALQSTSISTEITG